MHFWTSKYNVEKVIKGYKPWIVYDCLMSWFKIIILLISPYCRGVGAMELVAMDMKLRGMYIARQLSFHGVTFRIDEVSLAEDFVKVYNDSVKLVCIFWMKL